MGSTPEGVVAWMMARGAAQATPPKWAVAVHHATDPLAGSHMQLALTLKTALLRAYPRATVDLLVLDAAEDGAVLSGGAVGDAVRTRTLGGVLARALPWLPHAAAVADSPARRDAIHALARASLGGAFPYDVVVCVTRNTPRLRQLGAYVVHVDVACALPAHMAEFPATVRQADWADAPDAMAVHGYAHEVWDVAGASRGLRAYNAATTPRGVLRVRDAALPPLWHPQWLARAAAVAEGPPLPPKYDARLLRDALEAAHGVTLAVVTDNVGWGSNAWWSAVAAERLHQAAPALVRRLLLTHTDVRRLRVPMLQGGLRTLSEAAKVELVQDGLRNRLPQLLRELLSQATVVVTDQMWSPTHAAQCAVVARGLPLVHCSPLLRDAGVGYYYTQWDTLEWVAAVCAAVQHDAAAQARDDAALARAVSPDCLPVLQQVAALGDAALQRAAAHRAQTVREVGAMRAEAQKRQQLQQPSSKGKDESVARSSATTSRKQH